MRDTSQTLRAVRTPQSAFSGTRDCPIYEQRADKRVKFRITYIVIANHFAAASVDYRPEINHSLPEATMYFKLSHPTDWPDESIRAVWLTVVLNMGSVYIVAKAIS